MSSVVHEPGKFGEDSRKASAVAPSRSGSMTLVNLITLELLIVVLTQKVAFPLGSGLRNQIAFSFITHFVFLGVYFWLGYLRIRLVTLFLFTIFALYIFLNHAFVDRPEYSIGSFSIVFFIYLTLIFVMDISRTQYFTILNRFCMMAVGAGILCVFNWATQYAGLGIVNLNNVIPENMQYVVYNYIQPMHWGSRWIKPNGVFFLETSHLSQFIAMGLVIESCIFRRPVFVLILAATLMASFGGTGLLLVLLALPLILLSMRPAHVLAAALFLPALLGLGAQIGWLDNVAARSDEASRDKSSGYYRFVEPAEAVVEALNGSAETALLGEGAGSMRKGQGAAWPPYSKAIVEYGLIGAILWILLVTVPVVGNGVPLIVSWAVLIQYHFLNGSFAVPLNVYYIWLLSAAYMIRKEPEAAKPPLQGPAMAARSP